MQKVLWILLGLIVFLPLVNVVLGIRPPTISTNEDPGHYGLRFEHVTFQTQDGLTLRGWFIPTVNSSPEAPHGQKEQFRSRRQGTIIVGHGYPFDKSNILRHALFLHPDFHLLLFDFRYFGESEGHYTTVGIREIQDVAAAVAFLQKREDVDPARIGALGFSMSASTFILAHNSAIKAIVADSPYASLEQILERQFFFLPGPLKKPLLIMTDVYTRLILGVSLKDASPFLTVHSLQTPLLLIHGQADSQIPVEHSRKIAAHAKPDLTELWIIPNADHGQAHSLESTQYENRIRHFFERHL